MSREQLRVAVVGAGIAGLTVAAALVRNGLRCDVFEQARLLGEVGAGVQLAPNAARLLHRLGMGERLHKVAVRPRAIEMRRWDDNSVLRRTPLGPECEQLFGAPYYTVLRADLHSSLLERLPEGIMHLGFRCTEVVERAEDVVLYFADGSSAAADVVIGADGIHSRVRELLVRDKPRYSGQSIYRALVPADRLAFLGTEPKVVLWLGPGKHCICYPVAGGQQFSLAATVPDPQCSAESWSAQGRTCELAEAYLSWHPEVRAVTSAPNTIGRWALHDREPLRQWSTDRVTLIGDAAHPMLPFFAQGANQAIEDAVALAVCLQNTRRGRTGQVAPALGRYEQARIPRTSEVHRISRANTTVLHLPDGAEQRRRDNVLPAQARLADQKWIYGYDAEAAIATGPRLGNSKEGET